MRPSHHHRPALKRAPSAPPRTFHVKRPAHHAARALSVAAISCALACAPEPPLLHALDEDDANATLVLLEAHGLRPWRAQSDPKRFTWNIHISSDAAPQARRLLLDAGLPRREPAPSDDPAGGPGGILESPRQARFALETRTARRLESTLRSIDGVVDARVHVALPQPSALPLSLAPAAHPSASVLLSVQPSALDTFDADRLKPWLCASVEGLTPARVELMIRPRRVPQPPGPSAQAPDATGDPERWAQLGPWRVAPESAASLRLLLGALLLALVCAAATILALVRARRAALAAPGQATTRGAQTQEPEDDDRAAS